MMAVSGSLDKVAEALALNPGGPSSPQRKTAAIKVLTMSTSFNQHEKVQIMQLIRADTSVADTLLAIEEEELRDAFLRAEIEGASV
jgi:hypothetical protein